MNPQVTTYGRHFVRAVFSIAVACVVSSCGKNGADSQDDYSTARSVSANCSREAGLLFVEPDKRYRADEITVQGTKCRRYKHAGTNATYVYFRVASSFKRSGLSNATVAVEFFDSSFGTMGLEYDANTSDTPDRSEKGKLSLVVYDHGEYTPADEQMELRKAASWQTGRFSLRDVRFQNSQHGNADFRLKVTAPEFILRKVTLERQAP